MIGYQIKISGAHLANTKVLNCYQRNLKDVHIGTQLTNWEYFNSLAAESNNFRSMKLRKNVIQLNLKSHQRWVKVCVLKKENRKSKMGKFFIYFSWKPTLENTCKSPEKINN